MDDSGILMPVVRYNKCGKGVEHLENANVPIPLPGEGELLIKIQAASLNPVDWKIQHGKYKPSIPARFPYIPCSDVSGEVVALGSRVTGFSVGDRVVSYLDHKRGGGLAGYAIAEIRFTTKLPSNVSFIDAAGVPIAGLSALRSLQDGGNLKVLETKSFKGNILVTAASGGVGTYAVQLAKLVGAHVVATCGCRNIDFIKSLGADEVLDYRTPRGADLQSSTCSNFDLILHCASNRLPWSTFKRVLSPRGTVVDMTPSSSKSFNSLKRLIFEKLASNSAAPKRRLIPFYLNPSAGDIKILVDLMEQGKLKTIIDSTYPLSDARSAWTKCMEGHATGKIVVTL